MHDSVKAKWHEFSTPLEGRVHSMYVDVKNLVTTGVGNLIDPVFAATQLPWKHEATGALATSDEVLAAWQALKHHPGLALKAGGPLIPLPKLHSKFAAKLNDLRLTDDDIDALVQRKLAENVSYLRRTFTKWDSFPADGQLGILSMAWAVGPGFTKTFSNFTRAVLEGSWKIAIACCKIREEGNPGIVPRNARNRQCFANADVVGKLGLDVTELHWPEVASAPVGVEGADEEAHWMAAEAKHRADAAVDAFVAIEAERLREDGLRGGRNLLEYEHDTDPSELAPDSGRA